MALNTERGKVAHLLRRAGFGASLSEIDYHAKQGLDATLEQLLNYGQVEEVEQIDVFQLTNNKGNLPAPIVSAWWLYRMMTTRRPLQAKLALFWHDHFGCSAEKVQNGYLMVQHINLLNELASSDFRNILVSVAQDPTMLRFLDNNTNVKGKPNENFARELMELFTMGIGNYTEKDVQEAARAFTGWTFQRPNRIQAAVKNAVEPQFIFRQGQHDAEIKTVLGVSGNLNGDDVIDILLDQPITARYIAGKLWSWFVYEDPEEHIVDRIAAVFRDNNYSVKALLRHMFTSEEFFSAKAERALYKSPADFTVGISRAVDLPGILDLVSIFQESDKEKRRLLRGAVGGVMGSMSNMGQQLLYPPTVAGWDGGAAWVNSATMLERIKFADMMFEKKNGAINWNYLVGNRRFESVGDVVDRLCEVFDAGLPAEKRQIVASHVEGLLDRTRGEEKYRQEMLHQACRLIFGSPEFQFC
ncbi:MAG: DUF1800 domain-containing protein [Planctomycetales bacterium]|nr:DUF1800 domain-containing protein [bacterium]UNM07588.1 MAG: DUF1800 domain-containing protein [Planctomycetales bacterium]